MKKISFFYPQRPHFVSSHSVLFQSGIVFFLSEDFLNFSYTIGLLLINSLAFVSFTRLNSL